MTNIAMAVEKTAEGNDSPETSEEYTRIGEMAREFGVTLRALRFYEDKGLLTPERVGTTRLYSRNDKLRLQQILLGRKIGFSLSDIKEVLDLHDPKADRKEGNVEQLQLVLTKSERQMVRLQKQHRSIEDAISELKKLIADVGARLNTASALGTAG
ncbi:transcription regulator MerR DNA binding protein [Nitratireductor aquibiodomus RA22]|uniref:Transcription regulator MerR DNA binding protein n=1 Tax=Nitratireductor aquibiodomus RA22 TaxID=1189611 RepID=I5C144_9HYPH|nr:MerR family DNA-binding transcriptional regulator [Nitratireductor aquibiodomus]EIM75546.1 transcription regulator MerR DNA binding protein [Nitratireductor aquibiodomus RA22]